MAGTRANRSAQSRVTGALIGGDAVAAPTVDDGGDLDIVERALAILEEESRAWREARRRLRVEGDPTVVLDGRLDAVSDVAKTLVSRGG